MANTPFDLNGKVTLVTGGNSGIGLGMARGLAQAGARVVIWGRDLAKNDAAGEALRALGGEVLVQQVDVGDEDAVVAGFAATLAAMGRVDFVAANAGVGGVGAFHEMTTDAWRRVMRVNLEGVFWTLREACKHMVERAKAGDGGGSLAVTGSVSAVHGAPQNQAYASAKAGVGAMVRGIAVEYARHGVRANVIQPGWVRSDMTARLQEWDAFNKKAIGRVPMQRWGEADDYAGLAVYLASDVSRFHTGDTLTIDGGYSVF
ncbi:MAG: SDR family NAD(P)-dependent oxidoreductase [Caulobacterales bacterium]|jgi:NAD(P)-dependent dehydrogenase (short-subunit alcohol dehydrogenase family)